MDWLETPLVVARSVSVPEKVTVWFASEGSGEVLVVREVACRLEIMPVTVAKCKTTGGEGGDADSP